MKIIKGDTAIFDINLKVDNLHHMCDISDTYFRKIFKDRFNKTPSEVRKGSNF